MTKPSAKKIAAFLGLVLLSQTLTIHNSEANRFQIPCIASVGGLKSWIRILWNHDFHRAPKLSSPLAEPFGFVIIKTYDDFLHLSLSAQDKAFLREINQVQFAAGNPFSTEHLPDLSPIGLILVRGVKDFKRETFVSNQSALNWGNGYDIVRFKITQLDDTTTYFYGYRQGETIDELPTNAPDTRPWFSLFYYSPKAGKSSAMLFKDGKLVQKSSGEADVAEIALADDEFIGQSLRDHTIKQVGNSYKHRPEQWQSLFTSSGP